MTMYPQCDISPCMFGANVNLKNGEVFKHPMDVVTKTHSTVHASSAFTLWFGRRKIIVVVILIVEFVFFLLLLLVRTLSIVS